MLVQFGELVSSSEARTYRRDVCEELYQEWYMFGSSKRQGARAVSETKRRTRTRTPFDELEYSAEARAKDLRRSEPN